MDRQEIVAVDADAGDPIARTACGKGALLAAGIALKRGDGPLIVDNVENHRRLVNGSEQQCVVKIRLGAAAFANPPGRQMILAFDRRGHRPADRLGKLSRQVAGDGKDATRGRVIHDGQLAPLAHVAGVRQQLAHQIDERNAARDHQPLIAIRRKQHVARPQCHALRHRHGLLAQAADVKRYLAGPLRALHALIEEPGQQHMAQSELQIRDRKTRIPGPDRIMRIVEHPHEFLRHPGYVARARAHVRPRHGSSRRDLQIAEIRWLTGARGHAGQMQARALFHGRQFTCMRAKVLIFSSHRASMR